MEKQFQNSGDTILHALTESNIIALAKNLEEQFCHAVSIYDISNVFSYADYVIIATTISDIQRKGVINILPDTLHKVSLNRYIRYCINRSQLANTGGWILLDFKDFVIHLMTEELREFYEMDKIFFEAKKIYPF